MTIQISNSLEKLENCLPYTSTCLPGNTRLEQSGTDPLSQAVLANSLLSYTATASLITDLSGSCRI